MMDEMNDMMDDGVLKTVSLSISCRLIPRKIIKNTVITKIELKGIEKLNA